MTASLAPTPGYAGYVHLYTSTHDCGTLQGVGVPFDFSYGFEPDCPADLSGDGMVDVIDLLELLSQWGTSGSADLTGDGVVDVLDMLELLAAWGPCA